MRKIARMLSLVAKSTKLTNFNFQQECLSQGHSGGHASVPVLVHVALKIRLLAKPQPAHFALADSNQGGPGGDRASVRSLRCAFDACQQQLSLCTWVELKKAQENVVGKAKRNCCRYPVAISKNEYGFLWHETPGKGIRHGYGKGLGGQESLPQGADVDIIGRGVVNSVGIQR